eukprot:Blabericola_migrator_1__9958@NODE_5504_length_746_cov_68_681885_g3563_i0_p1_GENE_NODE_5504_length_746_cov_68_681885_g3563_i0NODE_5504_length_746_cov_68_681885_g3563_i0_p1_ORF_typecomplete_len120_score26_07DUF953/PF06110_11/4_2e19Thioredoxin/PF00085_20/0_0057Thioredoxin_9/PF14595_6/0_0062_NODE_5504_length_746_cov_68_681885_g3563_i0238597
MRTTEDIGNLVSKAPSPAVLYFFGNLKDDGKSWCPDCSSVDSLVRKKAGKMPLIEIPVGGREEWKGNPSNPMRNLNISDHGINSVQNIPTLVLLINNKEAKRLVESECGDEGKLASLFT